MYWVENLSAWTILTMPLHPVADQEITKMGDGAKDNVSASSSSSIIADAHNELYAFYTGKGGLLKQNLSQ